MKSGNLVSALLLFAIGFGAGGLASRVRPSFPTSELLGTSVRKLSVTPVDATPGASLGEGSNSKSASERILALLSSRDFSRAALFIAEFADQLGSLDFTAVLAAVER